MIHSKGGKYVVIGDDCLLSGNIVIRNSDGHAIVSTYRRMNPDRHVFIGTHVWIGEGVRILKGSRIGDNVIIGSSSLVTSRLEEESNVILAGNPAAPVRYLGPGETWIE